MHQSSSTEEVGTTAGSRTATAGPNAFALMEIALRRQRAEEHAKALSAQALAAAKKAEALAAEEAALLLENDPKRQQLDDESSLTETWDDWELPDHRREMTRVMNRRRTKPVERESARELRTGRDGYLHHARLGLIGAVSYWAGGSLALVVVMLVALIKELNIVEQVRAALCPIVRVPT